MEIILDYSSKPNLLMRILKSRETFWLQLVSGRCAYGRMVRNITLLCLKIKEGGHKPKYKWRSLEAGKVKKWKTPEPPKRKAALSTPRF